MMQIKGDHLITKESIEKVMKLMHKIWKYRHFFSVKGVFTKCLNDLMQEIDDAVQEYIAENSDRKVVKTELSFESYDKAISPAEQVRIIELLTERDKERDNFLGNFSIWKDYRLETIKCLREIAKELQKMDEHMNRLNLVASISGISAGIINVAKTVTEYAEYVPVPEYVQKAAPVLSAVNGFIRGYTSSTREINLERLSKKAEKNIKDDKRQFQVMMRWFGYNVKLMDSVKSAIGSQLYELIFIKLKTFYDENMSSNQPNVAYWKNLFESMVDFLAKEGYCINLVVPLAAVALKLFVVFSSAFLSLDWPDAALYVSRIENIGTTVIYGAHGALSANEILNANGESCSNVGSYAGMILDIGPAILDFKRLVKGDTSNEQAANINKIAETIEEEISRIEYVYNSLNSE